MAAIQTDTLANSNKQFKNAWSSLMLSIEDGSGILSQIWKGFIDGMTAALNGISKFIDKFKSKEALERKAAKVAEKEREAEAKANEELLKEQEKINQELAVEAEAREAKEAKRQAEERRKELERGQKLAANMAEKGAELNKKALDKQRKDQEDFDKWKEDDFEKSTEVDMSVYEASVDFMIGEAEREYQRKVLLIKATSKTKEEEAERIYQLDVESAKKSIDQLTAMNSINATEEEKWQYKEKIAQAQMDLDTLVADHEVDTAEKVAEKKKKLQESIYEASMQVSGALFDFMDSKYSGELAKLQQKNEQGLLSDKEYATQKAEIEIKQVKASARAIFDATINTATQ